ncbi:PrpF domain-containing protein [Microbacterium sp. LWH3-1.2]|uniref:PrpF domain-containing protein n=1 Tax=Microbacterium sp. LWH3-1.2 TaxID=3135256 RepID=UPI00342338D9
MTHYIAASWMRGGTSKCWVFERDALAVPGSTVDEVLLRLYGSPDHRQVDGIGGATSTTSKAVIVAPSEDDDVDVDYTFAQVGIDEPRVDWGSNCGNCSAVVAPYALEHAWVRPVGDVTTVRVRNTNTGQVLIQRVATPDGRWEPELDTVIPGVPFPGIAVGLGFENPAGQTTGHLLPTGRARETLSVGGRAVEASLVDAGAPVVVVPAAAAGLAGVPYDDWIVAVRPELEFLDAVRRAAAVAMGLAETRESAPRAVPKLAIVESPQDAEISDIDVLMLSMGAPHPALAITGSVAITMAADIAGSLVERAALAGGTDLRIRTPAGVVGTWRRTDGERDVVGTVRTARLLARAQVPLPAVALAYA